MALPKGFVLDQQSASLPEGFVVEPQQQTLPDVRTEGFASNEGGAAFGVPRQMGGRRAVVQPITPLEAVGQGAVKGLINPILAGVQVVGGEKGREFVKGIQEQKQAARDEAGLTGLDVAELTTSILNPINRLAPGGGYGAGALGAISQPLEGDYKSFSDVIADKGKQAVFGAAVGKIAENLISGLTPKLKEGAQELMDKGMKLSPGQAYEGAPGWLFRQIEALGLGPKASTVNKQFNTVVANDVLSSIDDTLPKSIKHGLDTFSATKAKLSSFYDENLKKLGTNAFDKEYKDGVAVALKNATDDLANPVEREFVFKRLTASLNKEIGNRLKEGKISGDNIKEVQSWLKKQVQAYDKKEGVVNGAFKTGYADVLANLNQYIGRIDKTGNIAKADKAWAKLYSFADATKKTAGAGGIFNPSQLATSAAGQADSVLQGATSKPMLQDIAQKGIDVIGKQDPMSGWGRVFLASKALTGAATTWAAPAVALPILAASGIAYGTALGLLRSPEKLRVALQKSLEGNPGMFGAAGQQLLEQLKAESNKEKQ
jgi:hypothetical protein